MILGVILRMVLVTEMVTGGMWEGPVQSASTPGEMERVKSSQMLKSQAPIRDIIIVILRVVLVIFMMKMVIRGDFYEERCCKCAAQWDH